MTSPMAEARNNPNSKEGIPQADASLSVSLAADGVVMDSIVDGPGLRCAIFCQGCHHNCPGCHNPATHPFTGGTPVSIGDIHRLIRANPLCKGVTFSGGEPFRQAGPLAALAKQLRVEGYELAAYTGYTFEELQAGTQDQQNLLSQLNILIDGRFELARRSLSLRFRGSANQRILDVQASLAAGAPVWEAAERWIGGTGE